MLGCFAEVTHSSLRSAAGKEKFKLGRLASTAWESWIDELNEETTWAGRLVPNCGTVVIENAISDTLDSDNYDAIVRTLREFDEPYEYISPRQIEGIRPVPSARPMRAVFLPNEHSINSRNVLDALQSILEEQGVEFFDQYCIGIDGTGPSVSGVGLRSGEHIHAGTVVCAAGAFTTPILDTVIDPAQVQPVFAGTGVAFVSDRSDRKKVPRHTVRSVNRAGSCGLHVVRLDGGQDYIGATNAIFDRPSSKATAGLSHFLLQCAIDQLDQWYAHANIDHWRVGNRPVTLDSFPLVGASGVDGLFIATGTYRDGFHLAPIIARIIADEIQNGASGIAHPFRPTRPPISVFSIDESLAECSRHTISTGFEDSLVLPRLWPDDVIRAALPTVDERIYDALGTRYGLSPDLLPFLNANMKSARPQAFNRARLVLNVRGASQDMPDDQS